MLGLPVAVALLFPLAYLSLPYQQSLSFYLSSTPKPQHFELLLTKLLLAASCHHITAVVLSFLSLNISLSCLNVVWQRFCIATAGRCVCVYLGGHASMVFKGKSVCSSSFEFYGFDYLEFDFMGKIGLLLVQILLVWFF